ncbi:peptidoglycan synthetase [Mucilaginibacter sp. PPCGB 2223]|uniref:UDP-N-acetylmuramate--L-alanine ligase n=1 Tax=Mucilaginibacter sp. PPCGB 2223 TaxID=1886027 RepID=UPI0008241421|nr:Mur ligase domain-containing protein [Mucilaginibacter sp. PPCGB 2223]OCX52874.1 peptidoglycan synthetase [Mucilaginibacter sp. PPCGB 2223]
MRVHFIAIGGSAMHNLAIALHDKGFTVSGSDDVLFEPSVSRLAKRGLLPIEQGWFPAKITKEIDAIILGMHARADNPELLKAQELGLKIYSYPEYIYEQSKDKIRVVIGGSHGKTTITSMILHVLKTAGKNFDYMVGAQLEGFDTMVKLTHDAPVIVIEGDEYLSSPIDRRPKFFLYKANLAVLSGIAWDHINVFPTFGIYTDQFAGFLKTMETGGKVIYSEQDQVLAEVVNASDAPVAKIPYNLPQFKITDGITSLIHNQKTYPLQVFGEHNLLNTEAARLICLELGIEEDQFYEAITAFKGAARRLELLGKGDGINVYKDFAHSPSKLKATIHAVKAQFPDRKLLALIELHTFSSLNKDFLGEYAHTMDEADEAIVFIDEHTFQQKKMEPYPAEVVKDAFSREDITVFNHAEELLKHVEAVEIQNKNLLFMSSGNFGGVDLNKLTEKLLHKFTHTQIIN